MPNFQPDQVTFQDQAGYGLWDTAHWREHIQFVQVLAAQTPPVLLSDYDFSSILTGGGAQKWDQESHQTAHELLADITGATAPDFADFDLNNPEDFSSFLSYHSAHHAQIRQFLGIV
jgi:hypothetical protein